MVSFSPDSTNSQPSAYSDFEKRENFQALVLQSNLPIMRYPLLIEQTGPEFGTTETNIAVIILVVAVITVVVVGVVAAEVEA
jgi:hypothetical protein